MRLELDEKDVQVAARKGPFEWSGGALIASLEGRQTAFEGREVGEVARREKLTLNNGEIDLDLVEPAGVDRRVDQNDIRPSGPQSRGGSLAAMGGTVVRDEEHVPRRTIGFLSHDLSDQALERRDPVLVLAAAEQPGAVHVPGGQISPRPGPRIFVLDTEWTAGRGRQWGMFAPPGLDAGLLVGGENIIPRPQHRIFPTSLVKIEDLASLAGELRITRENPGAMAPGPQSVLTEPAPKGGATDLRDDAARHRLLAQLGD